MKQAVWDEPPMDFDPDTFMARAEQLTKRRRALMSVGVATALIIATVATVPAIWLANKDKGMNAANSVSATTPAPSSSTFPWPPNDTPRKNHTYEDDQPYLESMWINVLSPALQRQGAYPESIGVWAPTYQPTGNQRDSSANDVLIGSVSYSGSSGPAQLTITIAGIGAWRDSPDQLCENYRGENQTCVPTKRADGSAVVSVENGNPTSASGSYFSGSRSVYHYRTDGSVVAMSSMAEFVGNSYGTGRVPLSFGQLIDLATLNGVELPR